LVSNQQKILNISHYFAKSATVKIHLFEDDITKGNFNCTKEDIIRAITTQYSDEFEHMVIIDLGCSGVTADFKGDRASLGYIFGGKRKSKRKRKRVKTTRYK
jgi:hypothetical protein